MKRDNQNLSQPLKKESKYFGGKRKTTKDLYMFQKQTFNVIILIY
jgi:hypothetical protein